ncbi:tRNA(Ile)-lysidine synthase [Fibrobacter sp. UWB16]|uniref:tRNA lysidine(34) synthetase TilS n=1 Tax=unclassified Fibrobacter TaxID=2634177 RepID=UPI000B527DA6|nr:MULTISPECIES: tRNA lysidine(34) synthetase TilS [unclassified Fibrobacter]OWV22674.1 tRNA lysidine(34) synthetase TilS [Fibrobacter sp. UWB3]SOD14191.1 tRNA(Ile)-lysidine synthase [Fibrobacter sp. UWB16]
MTFDLVENIRHHGFKRLLLAVSGGLDSICLAHYFIENRDALGIEWLGIAHVHHGLREGTADRDAKFVEEFAKSHDVPFFLKKLDGEALKDADGSLEENARDARYKALVEIALNKKWRSRNGVRDDIEEGCVTIAIVTAHHAGDQAETMYMRLKRGTTLAGLRGIQEVREILDKKEMPSPYADHAHISAKALSDQRDQVGHDIPCIHIYRPFLNVTRSDLLAYARENGLSWCEDESNADVKFARNKIRHEFLPNLERECPGAIQQLCKIAGLADKAYAKVIAKCSRSFDFAQDDTRGFPLTSASPQDDNAIRTIALDKKKLNKILREYANADLSEMFRLWLTEKGFRFPIGFFYGPKEPAHVKIPVRAVYRRRSVVKIAHTVWICEFKDALSAAKFVSCEKKEKDYNESTKEASSV